MPLEKRNPLPVGVYWVDVPPVWHDRFAEWLKTNSETVRVLETSGTKPGWDKTFDPDSEEVWWIKFRVEQPTLWGAGPGWPNTASEQTRYEDTVTRPAAKTGSGSLMGFLVVGIGAFVAGMLLSSKPTPIVIQAPEGDDE